MSSGAAQPLTGTPRTPDELRIVEIGQHDIFALSRPAQTTLLWTQRYDFPKGRAAVADFSLGAFFRLLRRVRKNDLDLIVVYTDQYPPWHWRHLRGLLRWPPRPPLRFFGVQFVRLLPRRVPLLAVDYADSTAISRHNFFLLDRCKYYFKRELPLDYWLVFQRTGYSDVPATRFRSNPRNRRRVGKLRPFSLGCPTPNGDLPGVPFPDKAVDCAAAVSAGASSTVRAQGLADLHELGRRGLKIAAPERRLPNDEYLATLATAWLTWSPEGFGWECFRHYEAALQLSVPVLNRSRLARRYPLLEGEHAFYYDPDIPGDLARVVRKALADKDKLRSMAMAARQHVIAYHVWPWRQAEMLLRCGLEGEEPPGGVGLD